MKWLRLPLYAQFLLWSALNGLLILLLIFAFAPRDESGYNLFLTPSVRDRLGAIAHRVADDVDGAALETWAATLAKHREALHADFSVRRLGGPPPGGEFGAGQRLPPPEEAFPFADRPGPPPGFVPGPSLHDISIQRIRFESGYQVRIPTEAAGSGGPPRAYLVTARVHSFLGLLQLLGLNRELEFGGALLLLSALLWWPFIWHITRTIARLASATKRMSLGRLDTRVEAARTDELGDLAEAINVMAARLEIMLSGQRQFVADMAHEIISPVARMQIGLGILESRILSANKAVFDDVRDDLEQMALMLNELLLFSRSGMEAERSVPVAVEIRPLVDKVVAGEPGGPVAVDMPDGLRVRAHPALLSRALANLIRNARRYAAGSDAPVEVTAQLEAEHVHVAVRDRGPGVPEAALARLGEPFFRPDLARTRATGGFGLGLAIVRRCVASCDGDVTFGNREGGGFEVVLTLRAAAAS